MPRPAQLLRRQQFAEQCRLGPVVVIDCEFHEYASERESRSLANQIMQAYGANRRAPRPFSLVVCGLAPGSALELALRRISGSQRWACVLSPEPLSSLFEPERLVYLSADSPDSLRELVPSCVYVIGGIVDRNRLSRLTLNKARLLGARCQRLPIREHLTLSGSHVLSVTACVNVLLSFYASGDWASALRASIPKRKQ